MNKEKKTSSNQTVKMLKLPFTGELNWFSGLRDISNQEKNLTTFYGILQLIQS